MLTEWMEGINGSLAYSLFEVLIRADKYPGERSVAKSGSGKPPKHLRGTSTEEGYYRGWEGPVRIQFTLWM